MELDRKIALLVIVAVVLAVASSVLSLVSMMSLVDAEQRWQKVSPPPPEKFDNISSSELWDFLHSKVNNSELVDIYIGDYPGNYSAVNVGEIKRFLEWDRTNRFVYQNYTHDCDDFAMRLAGQFTVPGWSVIPIGVIWQGNYSGPGDHAYNLFVTREDGALVLYGIEPQNDAIWIIDRKLEKVYLIIIS